MITKEEIEKIFRKYGFFNGRMISGSKSYYRDKFPNHTVYFNANIIVEKYGKVFYGDIDLERDNYYLQKISNDLGLTFIIIEEMLGRFDAEKREYVDLEIDAFAKFIPQKRQYLVKKYNGIYAVNIDNLSIITSKPSNWVKKRVKKWSQSPNKY